MHDIHDYIDALHDYRAGNPASIVECFSHAVLGSLANADQLINDVRSFHGQVLDSRRRVTAPLRAVAELCCSEPAFTARMVENIAGISKATAYRTVNSLTEAGLLQEERSIKVRGQKVWVVPAVVKALDDFAERAGRRNFGS